MSETGQPPEISRSHVHGTDFAEISRSLVALHKETFGRGPTKARSFMSDNVLVCVLEGGYMPMERTLRDHGRSDLVSDSRDAMQDALGSRFVSVVEEVTGRQVRSFMSTSDDEAEMSVEIFVLIEDPGEPEFGSEHEALHGWGDQVRRQSRTLREEQAALREEQARLMRERHPSDG